MLLRLEGALLLHIVASLYLVDVIGAPLLATVRRFQHFLKGGGGQ